MDFLSRLFRRNTPPPPTPPPPEPEKEQHEPIFHQKTSMLLSGAEHSAKTTSFKQIQQNRGIEMLLLGAEHSGKTTFLKQIQSIYAPETFQSFLQDKGRVRAIRTLIRNTLMILEQAEMNLTEPSAREAGSFLKEAWDAITLLTDCSGFDEKSADALAILWRNKEFLNCYANSTFLQSDDTDFVFKCLDIALNDTEITEELHLRLDHSTTTSRTVKFHVEYPKKKNPEGFVQMEGNCHVTISDLNLNQVARKNLKNFNSVVFVCSLADYDTNSVLNRKQNLMQLSLERFRSLCENFERSNMPLLVILSKVDIFMYRLTQMRTPISRAGLFNDCPMGDDEFDVWFNIDFIKELFLNVARGKKSNVSPTNIFFFTLNLLDKDSVERFFMDTVPFLDPTNFSNRRYSGVVVEDVNEYISNNTWDKFLVFFTSKLEQYRFASPATDKSIISEDLDESSIFMYKAGTYVVLRLNEAISAILKPHPFRLRGCMFVAMLASVFHNMLTEKLQGKSPNLEQEKSSRDSWDSLISGTRLKRTDSDSTIRSAMSLFASSVRESEESTIRSDSIAGNSLAEQKTFSHIIEVVLAQNGLVTGRDDPRELIENLKRILHRTRRKALETANKLWKVLSFSLLNELKVDPSCLVEAILGILHKVNKDICKSTKNHFQHSRLVKDLTRYKNRTKPNLEMFNLWLHSRNELDKEVRLAVHPYSLLSNRPGVASRVGSIDDYNKDESAALKDYLIRKYRVQSESSSLPIEAIKYLEIPKNI